MTKKRDVFITIMYRVKHILQYFITSIKTYDVATASEAQAASATSNDHVLASYGMLESLAETNIMKQILQARARARDAVGGVGDFSSCLVALADDEFFQIIRLFARKSRIGRCVRSGLNGSGNALVIKE